MAELAGVTVGNYFLLECLGREGMIERYRARPTTRGGFDVVVRLFRPPFPDPAAFQERFPFEVEKVWRCHHEHIQPLIEFGTGKDLLFDVTEYPNEWTLEQIFEGDEERKLFRSLPHIASLLTQICAALDYAHEQCIVHGNIQPSSLIILPDTKALLTNFSMKRMYEEGDPLVAQIQEGNASFVAPEQFVGILSPASDIYAVGVLLFRLLTGHYPYEGESDGEIALKHANEAIPSLRQWRPELPEAVELVVRVALAKSPEARFPNAHSLASAFLTAIISDTPPIVSVKPQRRLKVHSRRRTAFSWSRAFTSIAILLVLCGLIGTLNFFSTLPMQIGNITDLVLIGHKQGSIVETKLGEPAPGSASGNILPSTFTPNASNPTPHVQASPIVEHTPTPTVDLTVTPTVNPTGVPVFPLTHNPYCATGTLKIDSSPNLQSMLEQVDADNLAICSKIRISLSSDESRNSFNKLEHGRVDIAGSDLATNPRQHIKDLPIGGMLFALIVSPDVGLQGLSTSEIQGIFDGQITNWEQVGGSNEAITVVLPPAAASINAIFQSFVLNGVSEQGDAVRMNKDSPEMIAQAVLQTPGAISFVPLSTAQRTNMNILAIDGVAPSAQTLLNGTYSFWDVEHLYTQGKATNATQAYELFIESMQEEQVLSGFDVVPLYLIDQNVLNSHGPGPRF
jgi:ABC-type phosphate transport system substrate-binding protein